MPIDVEVDHDAGLVIARCRGVAISDFDFTDILTQVALSLDADGNAPRQARSALLAGSALHQEHFDFFSSARELFGGDRTRLVRLFEDEAQARAWIVAGRT